MRFLALLLLAGCASGPYWTRTHAPVEHVRTLYVEHPCGLIGADGCARRATGEIELRRGMSPGLQWCVLNHEKKHLEGYSHTGAYTGFATDCGNGETL